MSDIFLCEHCPSVSFVKNLENAVIPTKGNEHSVGYDLTAVSVFKKIGEKTTLFDTGLRVQPPEGYYLEILPRSSLSNTGYMLSNSVGVIDPDYRGNLLISLTRIDDSLPELQLPFTKCQLVLRKNICFGFTEKNHINASVRGCGGFGSTDKNLN